MNRELIQQALDALGIGHDCASEVASTFHAAMHGYKKADHDAYDADVQKIGDAIAALQAALEVTDEPQISFLSMDEAIKRGIVVNAAMERCATDDGELHQRASRSIGRKTRREDLTDIVKRLRELSDAVTRGRDAVASEFTMRIPAEPDRDADLVLHRAAFEIEALREELTNIAEARRFDRQAFSSDTEFADWAQSRCRWRLAAKQGGSHERS